MLSCARIWILLSTLLCSGGWLLSVLGVLNLIGYLVLLAVGGVLFFCLPGRREICQEFRAFRLSRALYFKPWRRRFRFRKLLPLGYASIAIAALLGGITSSPNHGDTLEYRLPRMIHWLFAERWHWIDTQDIRMNIVGTGFEWLCTPLILFTRTDGWLFLVNLVSYLMLPGLIFSFFVRLGVTPRAAWSWMWVIPSGWCYAMQAGGSGNDSFSTIYALSMVLFALRARATNAITELWISLLAAALLTGTKQTNFPLPLLWIIAAGPSLKLLIKRPVASLIVLAFALLASGLPMVYLNFAYTGTWTGWPKGGDYQPESPLWGILGNSFVLLVQNISPPIFPWASDWNAAMKQFLATPFGTHFASFENFGFAPRAMSGEQTASLGMYVSLTTLVSIIYVWRRSNGARRPADKFRQLHIIALRWTPWLLLAVFMAKVGSWNSGRYLGPYFPFLFPVFLVCRAHGELVRKKWWIGLAGCAAFLTFTDVAMSRQRPLLPFAFITGKLHERWPQSQMLYKAHRAYSYMREVRTYLRPLVDAIPDDAHAIAYAVQHGNAEAQVCLPFGIRKLVRVATDVPREFFNARGIEYVLLDHTALKFENKTYDTLEGWLSRYNGTIVRKIDYSIDPQKPPEPCYLVRLNNAKLPGP